MNARKVKEKVLAIAAAQLEIADVVGIGLCGGYTTWSTASWETIHLIRDGHRAESLIYTIGGLALCLGTAVAGIGLAALV